MLVSGQRAEVLGLERTPKSFSRIGNRAAPADSRFSLRRTNVSALQVVALLENAGHARFHPNEWRPSMVAGLVLSRLARELRTRRIGARAPLC